MSRNWSSAVVMGAFLFSLFGFPKLINAINENPQLGCGFEADATWESQLGSFKKTDTLKAIAIWAEGKNFPASLRKLPAFWKDMWDSNPNQPISVPRFFLENSDRKYILNVDIYKRGDSCFVGQYDPVGASGGQLFTQDILSRADDSINFANYDRDGNTVVDAIFICINDTLDLGVDVLGLENTTYTTHDLVGGVAKIIVPRSGVTIRTPDQQEAVQNGAHEWGHRFGLRDYQAVDSTVDWWVSGSFTVMGKSGFNRRASPFSPFQNHKFTGWNQPIDVNATSYGQSIGNYMSTKLFYRMKRDSNEYFEASYHSLLQPGSSTWEAQWPAGGVIITHIQDTTKSPQNKVVKQFDLELPHGLYDTSGGVFDFNKPNDSLGRDSLDLFKPYWSQNHTNIGSATCLWPATIGSTTKKNFDDKTNPSSRVYHNVSGTWMQNTSSKIAIEDIKITGPTASADLILNAWYDTIKTNTTLGPGLVSVIGDLTIQPSVTCSIPAGTTLKFQQRYDNLKAGAGDGVNMSGITVLSGGRLVIAGTQANKVKLLSSDSSNPSFDDWRGIIVENEAALVCSNTVIRNAYNGIFFKGIASTNSSLTRVRIAHCKSNGILICLADGIQITGCRVDSVNGDSARYGIEIDHISEYGCGGSGYPIGAVLKHDTVWACRSGIFLDRSSHQVDSCLIQGIRSDAYPTDNGIQVHEQSHQSGGGSPPPDLVTIKNTNINGYFSSSHLWVVIWGRAEMTNCNLICSVYVADSNKTYRSPVGVCKTASSDPNRPVYLKLRGCRVLGWGDAAIIPGANNTANINDLGMFPDNLGNNTFATAASGTAWDYIRLTNPNDDSLKAEGNWFATPDTSRFLRPIKYKTYGHISQNITWPAVNFTLWGDLTIDAAKSLKLTPPTAIYAVANADWARDHDTNKTEIFIRGTLERVGTSTDSIKFLSNTAIPGDQDWKGVVVDTPGSFRPNYYQFKNAYSGIDYRNSAADSVKNCLFQNDFMHGVISKNPKLWILNSRFNHNSTYGVYLDQVSDSISGCYFVNNSYAVTAFHSYGLLSYNTITTSGSIMGEVGLQAQGNDAGETRYLTFINSLDSGQFNLAAVEANSRLKIQDSRIRTFTTTPIPDEPPQNIAILGLGGDPAIIRHSAISYSGYGSSIPLIKATATPLLDFGTGATADSGLNSIIKSANKPKAINNAVSGTTLQAKGNWWGTLSPDSSSLFSGKVAFRPYLGSAPAKLFVGDFDEPQPLAERFALSQNYPNPFNPTTTISFSLPTAGKVRLDIYNILGQKVRTLMEAEKPAGMHQVIWNGTDDRGFSVASGIYLYKIEAASFREVKRMVFLK